MTRRTVTMDWSGLDNDDDDDPFFESYPRISAVDPADLCSSGSDDEEGFEDSRMSFASAISTVSNARSLRPMDSFAKPQSTMVGYDLWMSEPGNVQERRQRLLQGLGLASRKDMMRIASRKSDSVPSPTPPLTPTPAHVPIPFERADQGEIPPVKSQPRPKPESKRDEERNVVSASPSPAPAPAPAPAPVPAPAPSPSPSPAPSTSKSTSNSKPKRINLVRSRSYNDIVAFSEIAMQRKEELIGPETIQRLVRTSSEILLPNLSKYTQYSNSERIPQQGVGRRRPSNPNIQGTLKSDRAFGSVLSIKNLDNGKEFEVKECNDQGLWNKIRDVQTGKHLTMEEFEKSAGSSPVVKELMGRQNSERDQDRSTTDNRKIHHSKLSKSFRSSKKKGVAFLKNIKEAATSKKHDHKDVPEYPPLPEDQKEPSSKSTSKWIKSRQHGLSHKELTALHMTQDIQAHQGAIWTIKFSCDARFLATAGEDKVIHVWEVQECDVTSANDPTPASSTPTAFERPALAEITPLPSEKRKKSRSYWRKGPDYVIVPETVFALSDKPICTFFGHQEDVLDISWSKSQQLLSSSMDKTVRLWDLESKSCLKMFAHNDYVTCIQFNPVDNNYFMSGSLDAKVRIWNIPDHQVVDWIDVHEMVTAATYTPDGQGAVVGSLQGNCRFYSISDCKLECRNCVRMKIKAQAKKIPSFHSQGITNKITGFQFSPSNPSEVLITSTDSRIRLHNGSELVQKYRGFKNTSSQIWASFSPEGKHVISSSEDSQIYVWKVEESKVPGGGGGGGGEGGGGNAKKKTRVTVLAYEYFTCKDVSVAIPWPRIVKNEGEVQSKRHQSSGKKNRPPIPGLKRKEKEKEEEEVEGGEDAVVEGAWGLVVVGASLEGEIRVYQNFGLPLKVGRL